LVIYNKLGVPSTGNNARLGYTKVHLGQHKQACARAQMDLALFRNSGDPGDQWAVALSLFAQCQARSHARDLDATVAEELLAELEEK
jgi:hypothetical protein